MSAPLLDRPVIAAYALRLDDFKTAFYYHSQYLTRDWIRSLNSLRSGVYPDVRLQSAFNRRGLQSVAFTILENVTLADLDLDLEGGSVLAGVYEIRNVLNGKRYIGQSHDIAFRWTNILNQIKAKHHNAPITFAEWKESGSLAFEFRIIECDESLEDDATRRRREIELIRQAEENGIDLYNKNREEDDGEPWPNILCEEDRRFKG